MLPRPGALRSLALVCMVAAVGTAKAGLFEDDEARRAILDLRQQVEALKQARPEMDRRIGDEAQRSAEEAAQLRRGMLDLQNQLEAARSDIARLRGQNEQLARDLSEFQRRQKDAGQALDDRLRKLEPLTVNLDGKEFLADPAEKRDYEANLAIFRKGDFAAASNGFVDFLNRNPQSGYKASALFWLGSAQYANKDCKSAVLNLRSLLTLAPSHMRAPEAMLTLANCQIEGKENKAARKTLEELIANYPATDAANAAKDRLAHLK